MGFIGRARSIQFDHRHRYNPVMTEASFTLPIEETVVIVGVGLIGGSIAAAIKHRGIARYVIGVGRDQRRIDAAKDAGLIDEATTDPGAVVRRASLAVFCTPVDRVVSDVRRAVSEAANKNRNGNDSLESNDLLLTDVGSVKSSICSALVELPSFVGSHPIAGSHKQGFEAANPQLFQNRVCVITPSASSTEPRVTRLERFWQALGMQTVRMTPDAHDSALAMTSHLPHVVAAALASTLTEQNRYFTGTGFRDTTRIAGGDPQLWTSILMGNSAEIMNGIDQLYHRLSEFRNALAAQDADQIRRLLEAGKQSRCSLDETQHG